MSVRNMMIGGAGARVPDAPTIGTATAGNATASVTFSAPADNGGSAITGFTVTSSPSGITGTGSSSPITVSGLSNGTAYTFTVTATNAIGTGAASSASNSVTPTAPNPFPTTQTFTQQNSATSNQTLCFGMDSGTYASAYSAQPWYPSASLPNNGMIRIQIPSAMTLQFTVRGGRGGGTNSGFSAGTRDGGGLGARIRATKAFSGGEFIWVVPGNRGGDYTGGQCGGGGAGSFVSQGATWTTSTLLVAAGAGGGGGSTSGSQGQCDAQTGESGGGSGGGTSGNGGNTGEGSENGASGGGWFSDGTGYDAGEATRTKGKGVRVTNTPNGGPGAYNNNVGGFPGGAGGWGAAGGGSGYSGGGAKASGSGNRDQGGGGGSFVGGGASEVFRTVDNTTVGSIEIIQL
jgi:hypothetical protein